MKRILIERSPRGGGDWTQVGPSMAPDDRRGSGTAFWDSEYVTVVFGWDEGVPRVWMDDSGDDPIDLGPFLSAVRVPVTGLMRLADLNNGSFEMDGPAARWRWSLIDD